jgi:peptide/nickel transport system substrate-binding protein
MKGPSPTYLHYLAGQWAVAQMLSPTAYKAHEAKDAKGNPDWGHTWHTLGNAIGTGPYKLTRYLDQQFMELTWNDKWWGGPQGKFPTRIITRQFADSPSERLALEKGEIDMATVGLQVEDLDALAKEQGMTVKGFPAINMWVAGMNEQQTDNPNLKNVKIRQALSYAFPYDDVINGLQGGRASRLGPLAPGFEGYTSDISLYTQDLNKAKQLFTDSGVKDVGPLRWRTRATDTVGKNAGQLYQAALQQIGVKLDIVLLQPSEKPTDDQSRTMTFIWSEGIPDNFDPYGATWIWWGSDGGEGSNVNMTPGWNHYDNASVNQLLKQAKTEADATKRASLYSQAAKIVYTDALWLWISLTQEVWAYRNNIQNVNCNGEYTAGGPRPQTITKASV